MEPEFNRPEYQKTNPYRYPDQRYSTHPPSAPPGSENSPYNFMYSQFNSMYYPYPINPRAYGGPYYYQNCPSWKDQGSFAQMKSQLPAFQLPLQNFSAGPRSLPSQIKENKAPDVIIIDSNSEERFPDPPPQVPKPKPKNEILKQPVVIEIDFESPMVPNAETISRDKKQHQNFMQAESRKLLKKILTQDSKKQKNKLKEKKKEEQKGIFNEKKTKGQKYESSLKVVNKTKDNNWIPGTKYITKGSKSKVEEIRKYQKIEKKKKISEKKNMPETLKKASELQIQKNQPYSAAKCQKEKVYKKKNENGPEIAKYLESHGEIRQGKQFQSQIPALKIIDLKNLESWIEKKRKNILSQQVSSLK